MALSKKFFLGVEILFIMDVKGMDSSALHAHTTSSEIFLKCHKLQRVYVLFHLLQKIVIIIFTGNFVENQSRRNHLRKQFIESWYNSPVFNTPCNDESCLTFTSDSGRVLNKPIAFSPCNDKILGNFQSNNYTLKLEGTSGANIVRKEEWDIPDKVCYLVYISENSLIKNGNFGHSLCKIAIQFAIKYNFYFFYSF